MSERIYVINQNGGLEPLTEQEFDAEDILQRLIADHPELLDGEQIRPGDPRRWFLVAREKGIADAADAGHRWSVDHLMLDQDAVPTFVEVKRSSDSRIRREVVGQMLDYVAHATKTMDVSEIRRAFEEDRGHDANAFLFEFLNPDSATDPNAVVEGFWDDVAKNLAAKRVRLLFVADRIPDELACVVEFLNEQMPGIEVLGVEIKQFLGNTLRTLVPQVIGRVAAASSPLGASRTSRRYRLTMEQFYDLLPDEAAVQGARHLIAVAEQHGAIINRMQSSITISVQTAIRNAPITVAWFFPIMNTSWGSLKGFTIGSNNWIELPDETQAKLDELYLQMSREGIFEEVGSDKPGGSRGWAVDPAVVTQHIDLLEDRLTQAISILQSLSTPDNAAKP